MRHLPEKINASSLCDDMVGLAGHRVKIYVVAHPSMPAEQERSERTLKLAPANMI